jgi:hypothetical protein
MNTALHPGTDQIVERIFAAAFLFNPFRVVWYILVIGPGLHPGLFIFKPFRLFTPSRNFNNCFDANYPENKPAALPKYISRGC